MSQDQSTAKPPLRAIIYVRMSTVRQEDSPERQLQQCIPYATKKGYDLIENPTALDYPYQDLGLRGDDERPGFDRVLKDAAARLFDVIVCDEQSRLSRQDEDEFAGFVRLPLRKAGVRLDTVKEGLQDWESVGGRVMSEIQAGQARGESRAIAHRVHSNFRLLVMQGRPTGGGAPFGYRWEYEKKVVGNRTKEVPVRLVPDGYLADVGKKLFELYDSGTMSLLGLVDWLEKTGVPPPRAGKNGKTRWGTSTLRKLLQNDVYTGRYDYGRQTRSKHTAIEGGIVVPKKGPSKPAGRKTVPVIDNPEEKWVVSPIPHEPLVSQELFDRVGARLQKNRDGRNASQRDGYVLTGLLVCGHCGRTLNGHRREPSGTLEYRCPSWLDRVQRPCKNARIRQDQIVDTLCEKLERGFFSPELLNRLLEMAQQKQREEGKSRSIARLKKGIDDLDIRIKRAEGNLVEFPREEVPAARERIKELKSSRDALAEQLNDLTNGNEANRVEGFIRQLQESLWKLREAKREEKWQWFRQVINQAVKQVAVYWEARKPKTGKGKTLHRVPLRGVIYLTEWLHRILVGVFGTVFGDDHMDELKSSGERFVVPMGLGTEANAEIWGLCRQLGDFAAEEIPSGAHDEWASCAPEVSRLIAIPFSLLGC